MSDTPIHDIFDQSPTRELEEVQKVNASAQAKQDVREFHETDSAQDVLTTLGDLVDKYPNEGSRFLYIAATFGSGKSHLLKLIGFAVDTDSEDADLGEELANRWAGFQSIRKSIADSHVDRLKPVFLNLLNRDASQEPPLPYLIYEAIGRELGYPTDPNWLLEWAWQLDMNHGDCWEQLQALEHDGQTFEEVYEERASLRSWLYKAVPTLDESPYTTPEAVKRSIDDAIAEVAPDEFAPEDLVDRVEEAQAALSTETTRTELLLGLDEVALFIGDGSHRYREFQDTMEALTNPATGPNPPIIGTGQYPIGKIHGEFSDTDVEAEPWYGKQETLEGADTEIIVRKRWLQKNKAGEEAVTAALEELPNLALDSSGTVAGADTDPIEAYPFREYDLGLLRMVIQQLMPRGRVTEDEYVQGRALLILVRSLFTRFEWGEQSVGALVTWDELFDLLVEETTYVPLWVREMIENRLVDAAVDGDENATIVQVAKALFLLNQVDEVVPSTTANLARLLVGSVDDSISAVVNDVESALDALVNDKNMVLPETNDAGNTEYFLVSEEQEDILTRAQSRAQQISSHRISAKLEGYLQESSAHLLTAGSRHEVNFQDERKVPLRFNYSVLNPVERAPTPEFDAIRVRLVADQPSEVTEQVEAWQSTNEGRDGGEHVLVAVDIPTATVDRLHDFMGMQEVLSEETETYPELEADQRDEERALESVVREQLADASVFVRTGGTNGRYDDVFEQVVTQQVRSVFQSRYVLTDGITEGEDAKQMARFFHSDGDWPLSSEDAIRFGVDLDNATIVDGLCRDFLDEYETRQSLRAEELLAETVQRGGTYRGTPRESIAAMLIMLATANEIALRRDGEYLTDPYEIGRAVSSKTRLMDVQIRFESIDDPDQIQRIQRITTTLIGHSVSGDEPDAWLGELREWAESNSVHVKRVIRGVRREFAAGASVDDLEAALDPAFGGDDLDTDAFSAATVETQAERFARASDLFQSADDEPTLWDCFTDRTTQMQHLYSDATVTSEMEALAGAEDVPAADDLRAKLDAADAHRQAVVSDQYERVTGDRPSEDDPAGVVASLGTWLEAHEEHSKETVERVVDEFEAVALEELRDLFETAWAGGDISEDDLVASEVREQAKQYAVARRLLVSPDSGVSLWSELQDTADRLEAEHPSHPVTSDVQSALERSQPPSVDDVEQLLDEAENPFEVEERLKELAEELQAEYPDHDTTDEITEAVGSGSLPSDDRVRELIDDAERLLEGGSKQLREFQEAIDDLDEGSVVVVESRD